MFVRSMTIHYYDFELYFNRRNNKCMQSSTARLFMAIMIHNMIQVVSNWSPHTYMQSHYTSIHCKDTLHTCIALQFIYTILHTYIRSGGNLPRRYGCPGIWVGVGQSHGPPGHLTGWPSQPGYGYSDEIFRRAVQEGEALSQWQKILHTNK